MNLNDNERDEVAQWFATFFSAMVFYIMGQLILSPGLILIGYFFYGGSWACLFVLIYRSIRDLYRFTVDTGLFYDVYEQVFYRIEKRGGK